MSLPPVEPDTKDWTWVLARPCPECGFVAADVSANGLADAIRENAASWATALGGPEIASRPEPGSGRRSSTPATCATCTASSRSGSG